MARDVSWLLLSAEAVSRRADEACEFAAVTTRMAEENMRRVPRVWLWPKMWFVMVVVHGRIARSRRLNAQVRAANDEVARRLRGEA